MTGRSRIAIVEDHTLLAQSVGLALRAEGLDVTIGALDDTPTLLASLRPDASLLVLLDLELGGAITDGATLIPELAAAGAGVIVVSGVTDRVRIAAALERGAIGYVAKTEPFEMLLETTLRAAAGEPILGDNERQAMLAELRRHRQARRGETAPFERLTPREQAVLAELSSGKNVDTIAAQWYVSAATVRTQVRAVLTKLDVKSQIAAVAKARAVGWTPPSC